MSSTISARAQALGLSLAAGIAQRGLPGGLAVSVAVEIDAIIRIEP